MIIQTFNEVNLPEYTGEVEVDPKDHIVRDFLPSAEAVIDSGGLVLMTPTAPWAPGNEFDFNEIMFRTLAKNVSRSELLKNFGLSVHSYIRFPGDDLWPRTIALYKMATRILGVELPLYITEAGLHQDINSNFPPELVARETVNLLNTPIPGSLQPHLKALFLWILGTWAYTPKAYQDKNLPTWRENAGFEKAALRKVEGTTETFHQIEKMSQQSLALQRK